MKKLAWFICCITIAGACLAQKKVNPLIKHFGTVTEVPYATEMPDPALDYRIAVEVNSDNPQPAQVHEFFDKTASVVNLHALGGVPAEKLHMIMVIHGPAAQFVLGNDAYRAKYGVDNPNIPLFRELNEAGVKIFVCGQSLNKRNITKEMLAPGINVALSAITTLTTYQLKGYVTLHY